jgi:signal transduction histidine kinase
MTIPFTHESPPPWRESVLELVLRVASFCIPIGVLIALFTLSRSGKPVDLPILILVGVAFTVVALRWLPQLGFEVRATGLILSLHLVSVTVLATTGPFPGAPLATATAAVLSAIFFRMRSTIFVLALAVLTYVAMGWLAHEGKLPLRTADMDPTLLRNWIRAASTTALLSGVLAAMVAHVLGQLETSSRVLRTMYRELSVLHRRLDQAKEQGERLVSRELEAEVSQTLAALKMRLQLWRGSGVKITEADLDDTVALIHDLIARTRSLSVGLRPPLLDDLGIEPALRAFVEERAREAGLEASLEASGLKSSRLPIELETACFRIVEEAVINATHHPHAKRLVVTLRRTDDQLRIRVENDGDPSSSAEAQAKVDAGHFGLIGMRERVRMLGGELALSTSGPGDAGLCVDVIVPLA